MFFILDYSIIDYLDCFVVFIITRICVMLNLFWHFVISTKAGIYIF